MKFEEFVEANLPFSPSFHPYFNEALSYMLRAGGKHFRAKLLLGVVSSCKFDLVQNAYPVALGLECLHTYSLIHDDLPCMDNSDLRRGKPSLHKAYDEVSAVLVGDALNTHAFYLISTAKLDAQTRIKCVEILSQNGGISGMVLGQAIDCHFENKPLNLEELKFLHIHKTGKLIAASLAMGAAICKFDDEKMARIYDFGIKLGLAFQVQDDIIDASGDEKLAGKPVGNDEKKNSFTNLLGLKGAILARDELIFEAKSILLGFEKPLQNELNLIIDGYFKI